jgi:hypothetical protein
MCIIKDKVKQIMPQKCARKLAVILFCFTILAAKGTCARACSLWAATGEKSKDGGSLIGQNWDAPMETRGELRLVIPEKGFRYLGLFPLEAKTADYLVSGINERGFAVFTASADTITPKKKLSGNRRIAEAILTSFAAVDDVLAKKNIFSKSHPLFLLLADQSKIALVQIGSHGSHTIDVTGNGLLYQTNHFTHQNLLKDNKRYDSNSILRRNRLQHLLGKHAESFTVDDFLAIAGDKGNGPENGIWRTGSQGKERTVASWVAFFPKNSPPEMYFKLINPGSNELNYEIRLDKLFWMEGTEK